MKSFATDVRFSSTALFSHVRVLAEEIGPRGTGTAAEGRAADSVRDWLGVLDCYVEERNFERWRT